MVSLSKLRKRLEHIIFDTNTPISNSFDIALIWLIIASVLLVMVESVASVRSSYGQLLRGLEWFFTIIFSLEYLVRLLVAKQPRKYARSFFGIIDLLTLLPSYLSIFLTGAHYLLVIRSLRLLRVFRVLKLVRYLDEASSLRKALQASRAKITVFLGTVITLVMIIGALIYMIEGEENGFSNIPVSIYWAIVTLTTVGYGDMSPQTGLGKMIASMIMIIGYGIIAVPTGIVTAEINQQHKENKEEKKKKIGYKPCLLCHPKDHATRALFCHFCGGEVRISGEEVLCQNPQVKDLEHLHNTVEEVSDEALEEAFQAAFTAAFDEGFNEDFTESSTADITEDTVDTVQFLAKKEVET